MRNTLAGMGVLAGVLMATLASALAGTPRRLPDAALSSAVLFHVERIVVLVAGYTSLLVVVVRAWAGHLPTELSTQGFKYADDIDINNTLDRLIAETERARTERAQLRSRIETLEVED